MDGSIINRKREYKGPSSNFSSNLGRARVSPPRHHRDRNAGTPGSCNGRSVKTIVAWLESSSADNPTPLTPRVPLRSKVSPGVPPLPASSAVQVLTPDVEEYSLTLLRYRQYFTEKPLGRCLDGTSESDKSSEKSSRGERHPRVDHNFAEEQTDFLEEHYHRSPQPPDGNGAEGYPEETSKAVHSSETSRTGTVTPVQRDAAKAEAF
ncbi:hypothetical protein ACRE_044850 [Hapsidospora chrysogenum ATCC 11550]|uniref:Uncharacterized protein n=1 Tax=Hapsidospora chrysogenum (strain ATCC 11550 / CBS 779.69 / DSM 880 / IAM 14645 / JCM 23072 / IMI 49137) TaxID=857340 RepID=A0A086T5T9_HAPC1|nr:hypothetical protein ACRE_044850 [Hapsidospora chrysogenum ATCC 11550]